MAVYYRQGDRSAVVAPDVFVALGAEQKDRQSYRTWEEGGVVPAFVVEVAAPATSRLDATGKRETYERMGVLECWRFDPAGIRIPQGLVGWRLEAGRYEQARETGAAGWYRSEELGLELRAEGWLLRFRDPQLGRDLMTHSEVSRALQGSEREREKAEREAEAGTAARLTAERERDEANLRIRELEARLRLSGKSG